MRFWSKKDSNASVICQNVRCFGSKKKEKSSQYVSVVFLRLLATVIRTAQQAKTVRFLHVAFDNTGDSFLAGDHHGNIYVFEISRNRYDCGQKKIRLLSET